MKDQNEIRDPTPGDYVRMTGTCVRVETIQPPAPPPETWFVFEDVSARWELRLNGKPVKRGDTFNDFYGGAEGAVPTATEEAKKYAAANEISGPGPLSVVVVRIVERKRGKRDNRDYCKNGYAPEFPSFRDFEWLCRNEQTVVWSSADPAPTEDATAETRRRGG